MFHQKFFSAKLCRFLICVISSHLQDFITEGEALKLGFVFPAELGSLDFYLTLIHQQHFISVTNSVLATHTEQTSSQNVWGGSKSFDSGSKKKSSR